MKQAILGVIAAAAAGYAIGYETEVVGPTPAPPQGERSIVVEPQSAEGGDISPAQGQAQSDYATALRDASMARMPLLVILGDEPSNLPSGCVTCVMALDDPAPNGGTVGEAWANDKSKPITETTYLLFRDASNPAAFEVLTELPERIQ